MEMYKNIKTSVKIDGKQSKEFEVQVRVHQGFVLSPLLLAMEMDEIAKDVRGRVKEHLYADSLVLLEDSWEEQKRDAHSGNS